MALIMVQCGKPSRSSWAESVRSSFSRDCYGKGNLRRSYWSMVGRRFPIGNAFSYTVKRISLVCVCGRYQTGLGRHKTLIRMWKVVKKEVDLANRHHSLTFFFFGLHSETCEVSKDVVDNYRSVFESQISAGAKEKLLYWGKTWREHFLMVLWYGRSCNRTTQQVYKVSTPCFDDRQFKEEEMWSVGEVSKVCSWYVSQKCL